MLQASSQAEMGFLTPDKEGGRGPQWGHLPILAMFSQGIHQFLGAFPLHLPGWQHLGSIQRNAERYQIPSLKTALVENEAETAKSRTQNLSRQ